MRNKETCTMEFYNFGKKRYLLQWCNVYPYLHVQNTPMLLWSVRQGPKLTSQANGGRGQTQMCDNAWQRNLSRLQNLHDVVSTTRVSGHNGLVSQWRSNFDMGEHPHTVRTKCP